MKTSALVVATSFALLALGVDSASAQSPASDPQVADQLRELQSQRAQISLRGPIVVGAIGVGFLATSTGLLVPALLFGGPGACRLESDGSGAGQRVCDGALDRGSLITTVVGMSLGAGLIATALPWLFRRLRTRRELGRRIQRLRGPVALRSFDVRVAPGRAGARASFAF